MVYPATRVSGGRLAVDLLWRVAALLLLVLTAACGDRTIGALCAPADAHPALQAAPKAPVRPVHIYWDGSESIAGYVDGASQSVRPLGDLQPLIANHARKNGGARWFRFGEAVAPLASGNALATTGFYRCRGQTGCDNLESRIDTVLARIAGRTDPGLSIVVTDMWLSNTAFQGSAEIALGQPIRAILAKGQSIGLIGLRAPYAGPVYDVPGVGTHRGARQRPLYVMLIGSRLEVLSAYRDLSRSGSPALAAERLRFALFTPEPASDWLGAAAPFQITGDVTPMRLIDGEGAEVVPQFRVSLEDLRSGRAQLRAPIDAKAMILPGAVWRGPLGARTRVWRRAGDCASGAWIQEPPLSGAWSVADVNAGAAVLTLNGVSTAGLVAGGDYLIQADLTARALEAAPPETKWMRDWSVSPERARSVSAARPDFFPTLDLAALAEQLEAGLRDTAPPNGLPLATATLILRVEP